MERNTEYLKETNKTLHGDWLHPQVDATVRQQIH
jgi:hypothetical protein